MDNSIYVIVYNINTNYTSFEDIYFKSLDETIKYMTKLCETFFDKLYTKNVYALSKSSNEKIAKIYNKKFNLDLIGLRFFTVYGEWGRPDMLLFKLLKSYKQNKVFHLNNKGDHFRDFTNIKDVINILYKLIFIKNVKHKILKTTV